MNLSRPIDVSLLEKLGWPAEIAGIVQRKACIQTAQPDQTQRSQTTFESYAIHSIQTFTADHLHLHFLLY